MKIALMGDGAVGKTSLRERYMGNEFQSQYLMTIGADFATKVTVIEGEEVKFQIWDLAGQPRFGAVRDIYYRGTLGAILVFDVTRPDTFTECGKWVEECFRANGRGAVPIIVVGNKIDLRKDVPSSLSERHGHALAKEISKITSKYGYDVTYFETSAATGMNVENAFIALGQAIFKSLGDKKDRATALLRERAQKKVANNKKKSNFN